MQQGWGNSNLQALRCRALRVGRLGNLARRLGAAIASSLSLLSAFAADSNLALTQYNAKDAPACSRPAAACQPHDCKPEHAVERAGSSHRADCSCAAAAAAVSGSGPPLHQHARTSTHRHGRPLPGHMQCQRACVSHHDQTGLRHGRQCMHAQSRQHAHNRPCSQAHHLTTSPAAGAPELASLRAPPRAAIARRRRLRHITPAPNRHAPTHPPPREC